MRGFWYSFAGLLLVFVLMLSACAAPKAPAPAPAPTGPATGPAPIASASNAREQLIEAAKKEGEVAVWANSFQNADAVLRPFREKYPFIKVKVWDASTANDAMNKLVEEGKVGRVTGDIFFTSESDLVNSVNLGLLQEYDWKTARWPNQPRHKFYINYGINPRLPTYNTNIIPVDQGPKSWEDLALPKWRDKSPVASFSGAELSLLMAYMWGDNGKLNWEKSENYLTDVIKNNRPKVVRGYNAPMELLVSGEYGIFLPVVSGFTVLQFALVGAPIAVVPVGKTPGLTLGVSMVKNPAHPSAAKVFADWFAAEGGQLSKIQVDLVYAIDPEIAKVARANQLLAGKYKIEVIPVPSELLTSESVKRAQDFWLKLLGVN